MKIKHLLLTLILAFGQVSCSSIISARYSYNSETDFSQLNSYAWLSVEPETLSTPESTEHFIKSMNDVLTAKGFNQNPDNPDFLIDTKRVETYKEEFVTIYGSIQLPEAMIRINFLEVPSKTVIYESAADAYYEESLSQNDKNVIIEQAVEALVASFPPGGN